MTGLALRVPAEQAERAKRLVASASLERIGLIQVRAAHVSAEGCPVKSLLDEKPMATTTAGLIENTNQLRVVFSHVVHGQREARGVTQLQIDATYELIYSYPADLNPSPSPEELQAFADTNAMMNCWPYWRELVQSMVARMNLPPLLVPFLRYVPEPKKKPQSVAEKDEEAKNSQSSQ